MEEIIQLKVWRKPDLQIGSRVYCIELPRHGSRKAFYAQCPVCDGTGKINVRGYDMDCPYCSGYRPPEGGGMARFILFRYEVIEYIINEVSVKGNEWKKSYRGPGDYDACHTMEWRGFYKSGNARDECRGMSFFRCS